MSALSHMSEPRRDDGQRTRLFDWDAILNQDSVWITEDGRVYLIGDLDTGHLENVLPFVLRRVCDARMRDYPERFPLVQALRRELSRR